MIWEKLALFLKNLPQDRVDAISLLLEKIGERDTLTRIIEMENIISPSIGKGILLYKRRGDGRILIGTAKENFNCDTFDRIPPRILIIFFVPSENYVNYISHLMRLINQSSVREAILEAENLEDLRHRIKKEEEGLYSE